MNKFFKFFKNIYLIVFSLFSILVLAGVAAVGYVLKEQMFDAQIHSLINTLSEANGTVQNAGDAAASGGADAIQGATDAISGAAQSIIDFLNSFLAKEQMIGNYLFWIPVIIVSVFFGLLLLSGITSLILKRRNKKSNK